MDEWHALPIVAAAPVSDTFGAAVTAGSMGYALRASLEDVAKFAAEASREQNGENWEKPASGKEGAGRFFVNPQEMPVYDLRSAKTNIDREGILCLTKPGGANAWQFSDALEDVLDPKARALRIEYYPELEQFLLESVITADGRRAKYCVCAGSQMFTEDKSRGYLGAYARSAHTDVFEIRPDVDDLETGHWDPVGWDAKNDQTGTYVKGAARSPHPQHRDTTKVDPPLIHPYAGTCSGQYVYIIMHHIFHVILGLNYVYPPY